MKTLLKQAYLKFSNWFSKLLFTLLTKNEWRKDMMIKLYATEIFDGTKTWSQRSAVFSPLIMNAIKKYLAKMVEDEELLAELTKEEVPEAEG